MLALVHSFSHTTPCCSESSPALQQGMQHLSFPSESKMIKSLVFKQENTLEKDQINSNVGTVLGQKLL